jgi:hypothetical protein
MSSEAIAFVDALPTGTKSGEVPREARSTLRAIASFMHHRPGQPDHAVCYAARARIACSIGRDERTVRRHIAMLEENAVLYREKRRHSGSGRGGAVDRLRLRGFSDQADTVPAWSRQHVR